MTEPINRADAGRALDDIDLRRRQIVAEIDVPAWYWWGLALGWVGLGLVTVAGIPWLSIVATVGFGALHAAIAGRVIDGRHGSRRLSVRADLVSRHFRTLVIGFLVALVAVTVGIALIAEALGAPQPVLISSIVVAFAVLVGGPRLVALPRHRRRGARPPVTAEARFDELIHPSTRLSIVALLASADWIDFAFVRDRLELSDSALSKQFATLEDAGYISIERPLSNRRRRVRVRLTDTGRSAFEGHVAALRAVVASADSTGVTI